MRIVHFHTLAWISTVAACSIAASSVCQPQFRIGCARVGWESGFLWTEWTSSRQLRELSFPTTDDSIVATNSWAQSQRTEWWFLGFRYAHSPTLNEPSAAYRMT